MQVRALKPLIPVLHRLEDAALISALASMLTLAIVQIVLRNFFDSGFLWAESFLRILVLWVAILGAMVATREDNHINIDALSRYIPRKLQPLARFLTSLFAAAICATVAWYSFVFVQYEYQDKTVAFANVPTWACQSIMPFGFSVMALRFLLNAIVSLLGRRRWQQ
jgi:C4-dicarboxylate transporter, DctQ subunit